MNAQLIGTIGLMATTAALAWGFYWKSRFHRAKAEVYREFADSFSGMRSVYYSPEERRRAESKRHWMSLALCDPLVRDGLYDALHEADEYWKRNPERGEPQ